MQIFRPLLHDQLPALRCSILFEAVACRKLRTMGKNREAPPSRRNGIAICVSSPIGNEASLMLQLRLHDRLPNFGAAVGAFKGEVDLRHAPMRLDVPYKHRNPDAARTDDESRLDVVVMVDIGWHVGTPHGSIQL